MDAGVWLRAVRRTRRLSQRELAALAGVPVSTLARAEAGTTAPRLETFFGLIGAAGYGFALVDRHGRPLDLDPEHERIVDHAGRHFPAHLPWGDEPEYIFGRPWWGWHRVAFWPSRDNVPANTYWQPPKPYTLTPGVPADPYLTVWGDAT